MPLLPLKASLKMSLMLSVTFSLTVFFAPVLMSPQRPTSTPQDLQVTMLSSVGLSGTISMLPLHFLHLSVTVTQVEFMNTSGFRPQSATHVRGNGAPVQPESYSVCAPHGTRLHE